MFKKLQTIIQEAKYNRIKSKQKDFLIQEIPTIKYNRKFQYQNLIKPIIANTYFSFQSHHSSSHLKQMSQKSSQRNSKDSLNFQMHTTKKQKPINQSQQINDTGYGMIPTTQRKPPIYQQSTTFHFDKKTTPLKYDSTATRQSNVKEQSSSDTLKYRQTLQKLDQTQQKLIIADKKYGQLWRKYQAACESIKSLNKQLSRAEEKPFDFQVKCNLLQKQRDQLKEKLRLRQGEKERANDGLSHANGKVQRLQEKLEEAQLVISKLSEQNIAKSLAIQKLEQQLNAQKQSQNRSYQRVISTLKQQIQLLHSELTLKTQQLSTIQRVFYSNSLAQKQQSLSSSSISQLHLQLSKLHKEKLSLVASYQQRVNSLEQNHQFEVQTLKCQVKELSERLMGVEVEYQLKLQERQNNWMNEKSKLKESNQLMRKDNDELMSQVDNLQLTKQYLQNQVAHFSQQNKKAMKQLAETVSDRQEIKQLYHQLQSIKKQFSLVKTQLSQKQHQLQQNNTQKEQLMRDITKLQLQIKGYENLQIQYDKRVKSANDLMLDKIYLAQTQRQQMQRQFLAERLETIKLKQQLSQQQLTLKREYQLSLSNIKTQLSQKIISIREEKNTETIEKEKIYAQMKELERKYQLLASQMLTVNDMMSIATKVHKRHSQFVKK